MRAGAVLMGSFYVAALLAATPLAYAGTLWLSPSEHGRRTQMAAFALLAGWVAVTLSAVFAWQFGGTKKRSDLKMAVASGVSAIAAYAVAIAWGGRMLI